MKYIFFTSKLEDSMKRQFRSNLGTACSIVVGLALLFASTVSASRSKSAASEGVTSTAIGAGASTRANAFLNHSLEFVENKGQIKNDPAKGIDVRYSAASNNTSVFFMPNRLAYVFQELDASKVKDIPHSPEEMSPKVQLHRLDMELVGASTSAMLATEQLPGEINYYTADAASTGVTGVRTFEKLVYENVYPNIDMIMVSRGQGLKAEFIVRPGGDPSLI